jgi:hypothetical protein
VRAWQKNITATNHNSNQHYKCLHCACIFLTKADLQKHLGCFGDDKQNHSTITAKYTIEWNMAVGKSKTKLTETSKSVYSGIFSPSSQSGPVDQSGMIAAFATRKPRVQIPPGPFLPPLAPFLRHQKP